VSKSRKKHAEGAYMGPGTALAVRSSKLLRVTLPVGLNPKGGLGSHLPNQALHKKQPEVASSFYSGILLL